MQNQGAKPETPADESLANLVHVVVLAALYLGAAPLLALNAIPSDVLENRQDLFLFIYVLTLPLAGAVSIVYVGIQRKLFGNEQQQLFACAGILLGGQLIGGALGYAVPDLTTLTWLKGPPLAMAFQLIAFTLCGYWILYGFGLFAASVIVGLYAGYLAHTRWLPKLE
jgi:hypothetical protein